MEEKPFGIDRIKLEGVDFDGETTITGRTVETPPFQFRYSEEVMKTFEQIKMDDVLREMFFSTEGLAPRYNLHTTAWYCPFTAPRKRRGLTGKRYRAARRAYGRDMRRWKRGEVEPAEHHTIVYDVEAVDLQWITPETFSIGFKPKSPY